MFPAEIHEPLKREASAVFPTDHRQIPTGGLRRARVFFERDQEAGPVIDSAAMSDRREGNPGFEPYDCYLPADSSIDSGREFLPATDSGASSRIAVQSSSLRT